MCDLPRNIWILIKKNIFPSHVSGKLGVAENHAILKSCGFIEPPGTLPVSSGDRHNPV